jgi:hypothetical protein
MRLLLEVVGTSQETARFPKRNGGGIDEVPLLVITGVDTDFGDVVKAKVYRYGKQAVQMAKKGIRLHIKFRTAQRSKFDNCMVVSTRDEDIQVHQAVPSTSMPQSTPASVEVQEPHF